MRTIKELDMKELLDPAAADVQIDQTKTRKNISVF